jgi:hypothetical protein
VRGSIRNQVADTTKPQPPDVRVTVVGAGRTGRREQWIAPYYRGVDPVYVMGGGASPERALRLKAWTSLN